MMNDDELMTFAKSFEVENYSKRIQYSVYEYSYILYSYM